MTSILETLQYLKSQQVLHRDLKPDNLLFKRSDSKEICIIDFGLAEIYDPIGKYIFK
jgi:calcium/calmodulin-dependent protein kinase I